MSYQGQSDNDREREWRTGGKATDGRTVLDGLCGDLVLGVLVVFALDLDDDVVALRETSITTGLEAVAAGSTGIGGGEGGTLAALVTSGADEGLELLCGHRGSGFGRGEGGFGWEAAHGLGVFIR